MEMTLAQRAVAFVAIVFLFLLECFGFAAYAKMARPELRPRVAAGDFGFLTLIQLFVRPSDTAHQVFLIATELGFSIAN
jgi:hypothetical protein